MGVGPRCELNNGTTFPSRRPLRRPEGPRAHRQPRAAREDRRRRVHQRAASLAVLRRVGGFRRASRLHAGRRHPARGLEALRAHRSLLPEGIRSRHERELLGHSRHLAVDGFLEPRHLEARVREVSVRVPRVLRAAAARPHRLRHVRQRHRHAHSAVREAPRPRAAHARPRQVRAEGRSEGADAEDGRALRPPRHSRHRVGLVRVARGHHGGGQAAAVPRQRSDRVSRARSVGDRFQLHRGGELSGSRDRRADSRRADGAGRTVQVARAGAHRDA